MAKPSPSSSTTSRSLRWSRLHNWIREKLLPVPAQLDLNDLEGRTEDPTVKNLKSQHSIEIISITPIS